MTVYDVARNVKTLVEYFNSYEGKERLEYFSKIIDTYFRKEQTTSENDFDTKITYLIEEIERKNAKVSFVILKNKRDLFDIFVFFDEVEFPMINLVSSESFEEFIRRNPATGKVIENVSPDDVLIFLKAYYIYREPAKESDTALNLTYEYSSKCLEMTSISEKYKGIEPLEKIPLKFIILYDDEALPYSLEYLSKYQESVAQRKKMHRYGMNIALGEVRNDRFLGTSLRRY